MEKLTVVYVAVPLLIVLWILREMLGRLYHAPDTAPPPSEPVRRPDVLIAASIAVAFYLLCLWRLGQPNVYVFDEVHHVRTAMEYIDGLDPHEWTHPPLSKLIMAGSMKVWGSSFDPRDGVWKTDQKFPERMTIGWRFPAVVFGALALVAMFALARVLFENRTIAIAATTMLALDGMFFVHSRIGMTNIYTVCFILAGTVGTWCYVKSGRKAWLLLTGFALGLALATRWSSLWAWGFNGLILLWNLWFNELPRWKAGAKNLLLELAKWAATVAATMIALPVFLYFLSYVPFVLQDTGTVQQKLFTSGEREKPNWSVVWKEDTHPTGHGWYRVVNQQGDMWRYHTGLKEGHPYAAPWWSWPLMLRPTWYYYEGKDDKVEGIWSIGNAFIWWAFIPAMVCSTYLAWREKRSGLGVTALFGWGMWLCWAIKPRPLVFMHYLFEAIPFACIALSYIGWRIWESRNEVGRFMVQGYAGLIAFWFIFYYPLLSALSIPDAFFRMHLWLDSLWI